MGGNESAKYWLGVLNEIKNRGVRDIIIVSVDGPTGFGNAIHAFFPEAEIQRCIVHQIRYSTKFISYKDVKSFMKDLKLVYKADTINRILELSGKAEDVHEKSIVSVDGKESRGSKRKTGGQGEIRALQTLNVYSNDYGICLAQKFIEEKTNEIPAAQEILSLMNLKDTIVTADAMNCQKETIAAIVSGKGDYVIVLKGNQLLFYIFQINTKWCWS